MTVAAEQGRKSKARAKDESTGLRGRVGLYHSPDKQLSVIIGNTQEDTGSSPVKSCQTICPTFKQHTTGQGWPALPAPPPHLPGSAPCSGPLDLWTSWAWSKLNSIGQRPGPWQPWDADHPPTFAAASRGLPASSTYPLPRRSG